jgi:prevent-host-death family protein
MAEQTAAEQTITMTEFREQPGEFVRSVQRHNVSLLLTKNGKPVARLVPVETPKRNTEKGRK